VALALMQATGSSTCSTRVESLFGTNQSIDLILNYSIWRPCSSCSPDGRHRLRHVAGRVITSGDRQGMSILIFANVVAASPPASTPFSKRAAGEVRRDPRVSLACWY